MERLEHSKNFHITRRNEMFKKIFCLFSLFLIIIPTTAFAEVDHHQATSQETLSSTEKKVEELSPQKQEIIAEINQELNKKLQNKKRSIVGNDVENALVDLAFDFAFKRENPIFSLIASIGGSSNTSEIDSWFNLLKNKKSRTLTVYDEITKKNIKLAGTYIDNNSDETVIVHNGYRAPSNAVYAQAKLFSDLGYNILLPDTRSHNRSEGSYITFGYYEKQDLNKWIDQEVSLKPHQEIILFGASMGAATTMLSQETPHKNVKAYIEDSGYYSLEQQLKDTLHLLTQYFDYIPLLDEMDWNNEENRLIHILNERQVKPVLGFDLYQVSPLNSVAKSTLPKLFIHGDADWFIPPISLELLYKNAGKGYKDYLVVQGAEHVGAYNVQPVIYKNKITSFLKNVENMRPEPAKIRDLESGAKVISGEALKNAAYTIVVQEKSGQVLQEYHGNVSNTGVFSISVEPLPVGASVTVTIENNGLQSKPTKVIIEDKTPPAPPVVNKIYDTTKSITGQAEPHAKISVKNSAGVIIARGVTDSKGHFSISISNLKASQELFITATDISVNESSATKIIVEKSSPEETNTEQNFWSWIWSVINSLFSF